MGRCMSKALDEIVAKLSTIPDLSALGNVVEAIRATYDVDHVYYYALSLGLDVPVFRDTKDGGLAQEAGFWRRDGRSIAAISYTPEWIHHYFEQKYDTIDPVMGRALGAFAPIDWSELDWSDAGRRRFFNEAYESGIGNQGYTVPVRGPNGQFALFTVNKTCSANTWARLLAEYRTDFMLLAHHTHQQALRLVGDDPATGMRRALSAREKDAVRLIAEGLSRGQAAAKLGISENTFRVYIDSARHKLGALNLPHAVALAAYRGVITPQ
ncbi:MAG: LuxR family transcriptional regulator [Pseudomonadota bacterium]